MSGCCAGLRNARLQSQTHTNTNHHPSRPPLDRKHSSHGLTLSSPAPSGYTQPIVNDSNSPASSEHSDQPTLPGLNVPDARYAVSVTDAQQSLHASPKTGSPQHPGSPHELARTLTLPGAITLNLLDMIGVGPFITLPLLLAAMGGPQAMLGWIAGALLALCDGLVWAELGAAMPEAGGTYAFLRRIYPGRLGRALSFLFLFQLLFSAPLSVASGAIGLSQYATFFTPLLTAHTLTHSIPLGPYTFGIAINWATATALLAIALAVALLYRNLAKMRTLSTALLVLVLGTIGWVIVTGLLHGHTALWQMPPGAFHLDRPFLAGLATAMLIATYDYWGYYNVAFLGGEARDAARTIPRAILISIAIVAALYVAMNLAILSVLPWQSLLAAQGAEARRALVAVFIETAYRSSLGPVLAHRLGLFAAGLVMATALASIFALLLGYSRIPFAAARAGGFFAALGKLHPTRHFPHRSLLLLAGLAAVFSFFSLADVIAALVVVRILLQFLLQHVGVLYLRRHEPHLPRPFRLWLYPVPPILAILGFTYILLARPHFTRELILAAVVVTFGLLSFMLWERRARHA
jgi:amino acid transporter